MSKESAVEGFFPSLLSLFISLPPLCICLFVCLFSILKIFLFFGLVGKVHGLLRSK